MSAIVEHIAVGAIATCFAVAGLFFLRFWFQTKDRLFLLFALAFFILTINRIGLSLWLGPGTQGDHLYWVRFGAFALILVAIIDKNRSEGRVGK